MSRSICTTICKYVDTQFPYNDCIGQHCDLDNPELSRNNAIGFLKKMGCVYEKVSTFSTCKCNNLVTEGNSTITKLETKLHASSTT